MLKIASIYLFFLLRQWSGWKISIAGIYISLKGQFMSVYLLKSPKTHFSPFKNQFMVFALIFCASETVTLLV